MNNEPGGRRLLVIFNPTAGWQRRDRFLSVLQALRARGCHLEVRSTNGVGDAAQLAADACPERFDIVIVAGGDGTINEVISGLPESAPPLAIIPMGTANVLAAEIGLSTEPRAIVATILEGRPRPVTVGRANGRRFVLMAGAGFDAHVVATVNLPLKRWIGKGAYAVAIVRQLLTFDFPEYEVRIDGTTWRVASVVVANARFYGGRFVCAPGASLDSPLLQVCLFEHRGPLSALGYALAMFAGMLPRLSSYRIVPASCLEICGRPDEPVQGDGDIIARLHVAIEAVPAALRLVYPPATLQPTDS